MELRNVDVNALSGLVEEVSEQLLSAAQSSPVQSAPVEVMPPAEQQAPGKNGAGGTIPKKRLVKNASFQNSRSTNQEPLANPTNPANPAKEVQQGIELQEQRALLILQPTLTNPWPMICMSPFLLSASAKLIGSGGSPDGWIIYTLAVGTLGLTGILFALKRRSPKIFGLSLQLMLLALAAPAFVRILLLFAGF